MFHRRWSYVHWNRTQQCLGDSCRRHTCIYANKWALYSLRISIFTLTRPPGGGQCYLNLDAVVNELALARRTRIMSSCKNDFRCLPDLGWSDSAPVWWYRCNDLTMIVWCTLKWAAMFQVLIPVFDIPIPCHLSASISIRLVIVTNV